MKILTTLLVLLITTVLFAGNKTIEVSNFNSIVAIGNYKVTLIKSDKNKVEFVNTDDKVTDDKINVIVEGAQLTLKIKNDTYVQRAIEFKVYYKELIEITSKRGAIIKGKDVFEGTKIELLVNMGGRIDIMLDCKNIEANVKNGGTVKISGKSDNAQYYISKGGNIVAFDLFASVVRSEVLFGGEITLYSKKTLDALVKSGGTIKFKGNPEEVSQDVKLGGNIINLKAE
jgi:hypothetical protein